MESFLAPTWSNIYAGLADIACKIKREKAEFDAIVGLARGGWIPARILSDFLGVKRLISLQFSSYEEFKKAPLKHLDQEPLELQGKRILLVDDVADTGSSLIHAKDFIEKGGNECKTAAIYVKPWTRFWPDYFFKEVREWVVFPWEIFETVNTLLSQGVSDYEEAVRKIGLDRDLYEAVRPIFGVNYGSGDRVEKV